MVTNREKSSRIIFLQWFVAIRFDTCKKSRFFYIFTVGSYRGQSQILQLHLILIFTDLVGKATLKGRVFHIASHVI